MDVICTIRDFVDRHLTARTVVVVTILLLVASWIYPPWIIGSGRYVSHGWFFVFDTNREIAMRVDFGRLFLIDGIIAVVGGGLGWVILRNGNVRTLFSRILLYSLVAVPVIALIWGSAYLIQDAKHKADERTAEQAAKVARERAEATARASMLDVGALKQLSLLDVQCWGTKLDPSVLIRINGRVRNGLPRAVEKLVLKASFYNGFKQEIRNLPLHNVAVLPEGTSGFDEDVRIDNLPIGWTCQLEVIEAHYAK
jgi:hypothetical protein